MRRRVDAAKAVLRVSHRASAVRAALFALVAIGCAGAPKSSPPPSSQSAAPVAVPEDLRGAVARASAVGRQLYVLDKVAATATDVLLAKVPDPGSQGIGGYIPLQQADAAGQPARSFLVTFYTRELPPRVAYEVTLTQGAKPSLEAFSPPKAMLPELMLLVRARQRAIDALPKPTQPINPVLLPAEAIGEHGILVYLLAGTTKPNVAVLGKHYRAVVSEDGARLAQLTPLSKGILELPTEDPSGGRVVGLTVTHIVTDSPLETHVFASLLAKLPIYVVTRRGLWRVEADRIDFLGAQQ